LFVLWVASIINNNENMYYEKEIGNCSAK